MKDSVNVMEDGNGPDTQLSLYGDSDKTFRAGNGGTGEWRFIRATYHMLLRIRSDYT